MALVGRQKHIDRLKLMANASRVEKMTGRALYAAAEMARAEAHRLISAGSVSGSKHVPSLPGEPPNRDTGNLQIHLEARLINPRLAEVRSSAAYANALEFGTSQVAERPYMRPARAKVIPKVRELLAEEFRKDAKRNGR